jgi:hypothetical protein
MKRRDYDDAINEISRLMDRVAALEGENAGLRARLEGLRRAA